MDVKFKRLVSSGNGSGQSYSRIAINKLRHCIDIVEQTAERQSMAYSTLKHRLRSTAAAAAAQRTQNATDTGGGADGGGEEQKIYNSEHESRSESEATAAIITQKQKLTTNMMTANGKSLAAESEIVQKNLVCVICRQRVEASCVNCSCSSSNSATKTSTAVAAACVAQENQRDAAMKYESALHSCHNCQCESSVGQRQDIDSTIAKTLTKAAKANAMQFASKQPGCNDSDSDRGRSSDIASYSYQQHTHEATAYLCNGNGWPSADSKVRRTIKKVSHKQQQQQHAQTDYVATSTAAVCCCCCRLRTPHGESATTTTTTTTNVLTTTPTTTSPNASQLLKATTTKTSTNKSSTTATSQSQISLTSAIAAHNAGTNFITHQQQNMLTTTTTTTCTNIPAPIRRMLQTFQLLLFLCIQMQFLRPIYKRINSFLYKNNSNYSNNNNNNNNIAYTTNSNSSNSRNSDNSYIEMKFNKRQQQQQQQENPELLEYDEQQLWPAKPQPQQQQQQQRPPLKRLMKQIRCNSYYNNYNNYNDKDNNNIINNSNNNATNLYNASQQKQKPQIYYDNANNNNNNNNNNSFNNSKLYNNNKCSQLQLQPHMHHNHQIVQQQQPQQKHYCNLMQLSSSRTSPKSTLTSTTTAPSISSSTSHQNLVQQQQQQQHLKSNNFASLQLQLQHLRYFKMPNLSFLYILLIIISFLSLFLPSINAQTSHAIAAPAISESASASTSPSASPSAEDDVIHTLPVTLSRTEIVCRSLDIRNSPDSLKQLRNCTVIEGFLLITLMNQHKVEEFSESFPLLTEVTEFIIVYRVHHLRSLSQLFPNLSVIRGATLFEGYALIVYYNPHLEDLGLSKLTTISRGGIRLENNIVLCYIDTIAWKRILHKDADMAVDNNSKLVECPKCPGDGKSFRDDGTESDLVCREVDGQRRCWNNKMCQKICPDRCKDNCIDENTCCNENCIGGCLPNNLDACISCRDFSIYNNTCIKTCPSKYFSYLGRRCITADNCNEIGTKYENNKAQVIVPYDGKCSTRCPIGYNKVGTTCEACGDNCVNNCNGALIDSVERAKDFTGCTHIVRNGLTINIKRGGKHLMEELESGLASIQEITTYLKIQGTYGLTSLSFFKHLKRIGGTELAEDKFAIYALENNDLETLWGPNRTVIIENGRVFFHFNPKLCYNEIEKLLPMMKENATFDKNEVATDSNGHKGSCNTEMLNVTVVRLSSRVAVVQIENPLIFDDNRTFIGYQYHYIEDKYRNATKVSQRVCDDSWFISDPTKETRFIFVNLKPFTQYAYYVKTWTISSEKRNAQSPIKYFKTKSAQPGFVLVMNSYPISSSEIVITWLPPINPQGNLITYRVHAVLDTRSQVMETRNYCKDPAQVDKEPDKKDPTRDSSGGVTEKSNAANCNCDGDKRNTGDIDTSEANIVAGIDFENTLQNFIYVKRTDDTKKTRGGSGSDINVGLTDMDAKRRRRRSHSEGEPENSFLIRHMRATDDNLENIILKTTAEIDSTRDAGIITTIAPIENTTLHPTNNSTNNETVMDPTGQYYESFAQNVSINTSKFVFDKLKHFSYYIVGVEACREPEKGATDKECSDMRLRFVRTKKMEDVDKVENLRVDLIPTNTSRSDVRIRWDPPVNPNGDVVSYTISYKKSEQDAVEEKRCITEDFYRNLTNGYIMQLPTGNYSIRVRANSLAGDGVYSEIVYVDIPPEKWSAALIASICVGIIALLILIIGSYWYLRRKYAPPSEIKIIPTVNPYYISMQYVPDSWEVERERVIQLSPLGQGSFGMVYEGILKSLVSSVEDTPCAIKTVNENATDRERINFLSEASVMKQFDTHHVVRLLGVCSIGQPALVVMELMKFGDLKSYLRAHRPDTIQSDDTPFRYREAGVQPPPLSRVFRMAIEIGDGMAYLSAKKFVHRDLAARNCMVGADLTVKIGDFGMTRDVYETDYYRKGDKGLLPVRWMPPESLRDGIYSTASDVFSYGVVLWEIITLASQPYPGYSNDQVLRFVIEGGVMERPDNCPDTIYAIMQQCWEHRPTKRPSFSKILRILLDHVQTDTSDEEYIDHFHEVSFYFSEDGTREREKERAGIITIAADIFSEDNEIDDATTPLRTDEYKEYKSKLGTASSGEQVDEIMVDDDERRHSPFSHSPASAKIVSSTPDGQSKKSYNISQKSHTNPTLLSSLPSTSTGIISGGSHSLSHFLHQPGSHLHSMRPKKFSLEDTSTANYILPDPDPSTISSATRAITTDDRGYEIYDPSPNYHEQVPYDSNRDEDDIGSMELSGGSRSRIGSGGQKLLPRSKPRYRMPTIRQMSSSAPDDEIIEAPIASSLHPSTASAASSNASSLQPPTGGRYSGLRAVADKMQAMPKRLKNINRRIFSHKRSGSNTSHKSTSSNPITSSSSNSNLAGAPGTASNQNLGTIESGGSGSAASYVPAPRFYTPATDVKDAITSGKPQYHLLDESVNSSHLSATDETAPHTQGATQPTTGGKMSYKRLNESLNVTASPGKSTGVTTTSAIDIPQSGVSSMPTQRLSTQSTSDYTQMGPASTGADSTLHTTANPNYLAVDQPPAHAAQQAHTITKSPLAQPTQLDIDPAYTMMGPMSGNERKNEKTTPIRKPKGGRDIDDDDDYDNDDSDDDEDDDDDETEHIKMKLLGANRRNTDKAQQQQSQSRVSRSRSQSHNTADAEKSTSATIKHGSKASSKVSSPTTTPSGGPSSMEEGAIGYASIVPMSASATNTPTATTHSPTSAQARPSSAFSLKENWLRQQQQTSPAPQQPPPNGFLGGDT